MMVIPAVDILEGRAVRLEQGDYDRVSLEGGDPLELVAAAARSRPPFVHVIALDAARDGGVPFELASQVVAAASPVPVQLGGGVRSVADAVALADAGVSRVLVGSAAFGPIPLHDFVTALGDRVVVAVDVAEGTVRTAGWLSDSGLSPEDALLRCAEAGVERVLCTAIARDGTAAGPDLDLIRQARAAFAGEILAAGGVRNMEDVEALAEAGADGAVVGRAWLEGTLRGVPGTTRSVTAIAIAVFEGAEELDFVGPWEVLGAWRHLYPDEVSVCLVGDSLDPVTCAKGLRVLPELTWDDLGAIDVLVYPGGRGTRAKVGDESVRERLRSLRDGGTLLASVCTGALVFADAGLLDGLPATTYWSSFDELLPLGRDIEPRPDDRFVDTGEVITAAGVSAGIDMALHLVGRLASPERAREVRRYIQYDPQPPY